MLAVTLLQTPTREPTPSPDEREHASYRAPVLSQMPQMVPQLWISLVGAVGLATAILLVLAIA